MFPDFFSRVDNKWFFSNPSPILRYLLVFVKGNLLVLLPLFTIIVLLGFVSLEFMLVLLGIYISCRGMGEMFYWTLQQFGPRTYRPDDFGFANLDNNAIYVIYQLIGLSGMVLGLGLTVMLLFY